MILTLSVQSHEALRKTVRDERQKNKTELEATQRTIKELNEELTKLKAENAELQARIQSPSPAAQAVSAFNNGENSGDAGGGNISPRRATLLVEMEQKYHDKAKELQLFKDENRRLQAYLDQIMQVSPL